MKIQKILQSLNNNALDITIDTKILSTRFFRLELEKYKSLDVDWDNENFIYFWETFFLAKEYDIKRLYNAMTTEYNPLENYNKMETSTTNTENATNTENTNVSLNDITDTLEKTTYNSENLITSEKQQQNQTTLK